MSDRDEGVVMIVEDDDELRFILSANLRTAGYDVLEAKTGPSAIDLARSQPPDLIIMDVGLPGLDGIAATRVLKGDARTERIPIIILTGRTGTSNIVRGLDAGAQEYLPKPFDTAELMARVRTVHRMASVQRDLDRLNTKLEAEVDLKTRRLQRLYEFMRDLHVADSRTRILDLLISCVEETTSAKRISLFLVDRDRKHLVCERAVGMDPLRVEPMPLTEVGGVTGQVFRSGSTLAATTCDRAGGIGSAYKTNAFVSTPLIRTSLETREGILGVLNVTHKEGDDYFADEEVECIRSVTNAAAIALESVIRNERFQQSVRVLLQTVGHLAEYRDEETTLHIERVARMARILGEELHRNSEYAPLITTDFLDILVQAAPMHDIGKVGIPDEILTKPGKLTDEEFQIMKTHTDIGRRVLSQALDPSVRVPLLDMCIDIAYGHHERFNGRGYPRRIAGGDIPLAARIVALVDAYDAITSRRRYKEAKSHADAVEIIREESGQHFDPVLVAAFLRCEEEFSELRQRLEDTPATLAAGPA